MYALDDGIVNLGSDTGGYKAEKESEWTNWI